MSFFDPDGFFFEVNHKPTDPQPDGFVIRRTTLIVNDVDVSLDVYRNGLGLETWYDQEMEIGGQVLPAGQPGSRVRVAILKCEAPDTGMLGIMGFIQPPIEPPPSMRTELTIGDVVFVTTARDDLGRLHANLERLPCRIHSQPIADEVTGADGATIRLTTMSFFDPDGYFFELNQRQAAE